MNNKIFVAVPISGFNSETEYQFFRESVMKLISELRNRSFSVHSEIEEINDQNDYDSPEQSVRHDFEMIKVSDIFVLLYPKRIQSSALIELGYAFAINKPIVIIGPQEALPFLAQGLPLVSSTIDYIDSVHIDTERIIQAILNICNNGKKKDDSDFMNQ